MTLVIASINCMNPATARPAERAREVAVRKVMAPKLCLQRRFFSPGICYRWFHCSGYCLADGKLSGLKNGDG
ncbi:MAG: hypothetical protein MI921_18800 [Cytophagales bacterium]|nr:hypothetical protein [Cytophagales bacterium]